jgi:hypothetical protein
MLRTSESQWDSRAPGSRASTLMWPRVRPAAGITSSGAMNTALAVAAITAAITALGWLVTSALTNRREREARAVGALLAHTERQLERLYGPLEFMRVEGHQLFHDLLSDLGRHFVFPPSGQLAAEELRRWLFFLEHSAMPRNERIRQLLEDNTHLIEGNELPDSYRRFLEHYGSWKLDHLRWQREGVEYAWHSRINWPTDFDRDIHETFQSLKERHALLLDEVAALGSQKPPERVDSPS